MKKKVLELGAGSWELGAGSWELGVQIHRVQVFPSAGPMCHLFPRTLTYPLIPSSQQRGPQTLCDVATRLGPSCCSAPPPPPPPPPPPLLLLLLLLQGNLLIGMQANDLSLPAQPIRSTG
ncbi:hypothetical protein EYF80_029634 [Liparis tanakae]|uniref:Uncharacterized protein n=1 Tax=Liparis tanakae TaxID=230148 RepID=A0A4Z2H4S0_9TELE|nr:hypothetical protein EYF80_029634 [Liparis tanakae]